MFNVKISIRTKLTNDQGQSAQFSGNFSFLGKRSVYQCINSETINLSELIKTTYYQRERTKKGLVTWYGRGRPEFQKSAFIRHALIRHFTVHSSDLVGLSIVLKVNLIDNIYNVLNFWNFYINIKGGLY